MNKRQKRHTTDATLNQDLEASLALQTIETHPCRIARREYRARVKAEADQAKKGRPRK